MIADDLILNNLRLIDYTIYKLGIKKDLENFYDVGLKALVVAGHTYDKTKDCEFSSYAITCIKYEFFKYIKTQNCNKRKANNNTISLNATMYVDKNGNEISLLDMLSDETNLEEDILNQEKINLLKTIISILEPNDKFMLEHYFELWGKEKMTQTEIADVLGVKQSYVSYRIKRAMRIIKKIMEDKYEKEN